MKIEVWKHPTDADWLLCKKCTLNTVGKTSTKLPLDEWKVKILKSEHSPIRELWFTFKLEIPYYVSNHLVRHHVGCNHYVQSQRNDRQEDYDRTKAPQDASVSHVISLNGQAFIDFCHARLCNQADPATREVAKMMVEAALVTNPEFKEVLEPKCKYRNGKCTEFFPCKGGN